MKNENVFKRMLTINGEEIEAIVTVYEDNVNLAISTNWEPLVFADNETWLANIVVGNKSMDLTTSGTVTITNNDGDILFTNNDWKELKELILKEGKLDEEKYNVSDNNWFSLLLADGELNELGQVEYQTYDDVVFEDAPTSITELVDMLFQYAENVIISENR